MKILHVIHSVNPQAGGTTEGVRHLSAALVRRGASVEVMSLDAPDAPWLRDFPFTVTALGPGLGGYGYSARVIPWLINHAADYDVIVVNGLWQYGNRAVWLAAQKTPLRYVVFPHGMLDPWFKRHYPLKHLKKWLYWPWAEYRVLRDAAAVFFTSDEERQEARKSFSLYRCREEVIGFGIDPPPGDSIGSREGFFRQFPSLAGKRLFLFLGRVHEKKGCDLLLEAFRSLLSRVTPRESSDLHLVMAGPTDSPYGEKMLSLTRELGLEKHVTWTGMLTGELKWGAFRAAEAFVLPSHQENFGVSVVEAMACRRAVLISDKVNIWREIIEDEAGLVDSDDLTGTVRLLERWMGLPPDVREQMHVAAEASFERRFLMDRVAEKLLKSLESLKAS